MNQSDVAQAVFDALNKIAQVAMGDWAAFPGPVEGLEPPAYVVLWGPDPMRTIESMCSDQVQIQVVAVGARLDIQGTYPVMAVMADAAVAALAGAGLRPYQSLAPAPFEMANLNYLAARILIRQSVSVGGM